MCHAAVSACIICELWRTLHSSLAMLWAESILGWCRDGNVYGCGSTKHGQLPSLRFGNGQPGVQVEEDGLGSPHSDDSQDAEQRPPRNEMTVPTKLRLPFMQPGRPGSSKTPIVCAVIAGSNASAFLTRAQSEFPETSHIPLWTRYSPCAIPCCAFRRCQPFSVMYRLAGRADGPDPRAGAASDKSCSAARTQGLRQACLTAQL